MITFVLLASLLSVTVVTIAILLFVCLWNYKNADIAGPCCVIAIGIFLFAAVPLTVQCYYVAIKLDGIKMEGKP